MTPLTVDQATERAALLEALRTQGRLARIARAYLRSTPEYADARKQGIAQEWLEAESRSMADYLYEAMRTRDLEAP